MNVHNYRNQLTKHDVVRRFTMHLLLIQSAREYLSVQLGWGGVYLVSQIKSMHT